jgi:hypothetical protein
MEDAYSSQVGSSSGTPAASQPRATDESWSRPSSSRMLTNYLADVEQNLDEHRWDLALRDVVDLPKIVVALSDTELHSSPERCKAWCEQWVRPPTTENAAGVDHEHICRVLSDKSGPVGSTAESAIPTRELRRLRLRRHARNAPRGFNASHASKAAHNAAEIFAVCTAVVEAVRRWYAHFAVHDAVAQANLARLAVLR